MTPVQKIRAFFTWVKENRSEHTQKPARRGKLDQHRAAKAQHPGRTNPPPGKKGS